MIIRWARDFYNNPKLSLSASGSTSGWYLGEETPTWWKKRHMSGRNTKQLTTTIKMTKSVVESPSCSPSKAVQKYPECARTLQFWFCRSWGKKRTYLHRKGFYAFDCWGWVILQVRQCHLKWQTGSVCSRDMFSPLISQHAQIYESSFLCGQMTSVVPRLQACWFAL